MREYLSRQGRWDVTATQATGTKIRVFDLNYDGSQRATWRGCCLVPSYAAGPDTNLTQLQCTSQPWHGQTWLTTSALMAPQHAARRNASLLKQTWKSVQGLHLQLHKKPASWPPRFLSHPGVGCTVYSTTFFVKCELW